MLARLDPKVLRPKARQAAILLRAMANERRLMILCELADGERTATELARAAGLQQSAASQHLAKLRADGLVRTRRNSQTIHYRLASREVMAVIDTLMKLYCPPTSRNRRK